MLQVVCIKQVADTETRVKPAADGRSLDPGGVTWILNPYDEFAVEGALRLKEQDGAGEVVAITLGPAGAAAALRTVLAMGADRAIHLRHDGPAPDSLAVARALADAIRALDPALTWLGKQAVDDDQAAVGPMLAELLGHPCATAISTLERTGETLRVSREIEGGREVIELSLPAVLTTDKGLNEPRYASLKGIMAAKKKPLEEQAVTPAAAAVEVLSLQLPPARGAGRIVGSGVQAVPELIRVLREEAKVI